MVQVADRGPDQEGPLLLLAERQDQQRYLVFVLVLEAAVVGAEVRRAQAAQGAPQLRRFSLEQLELEMLLAAAGLLLFGEMAELGEIALLPLVQPRHWVLVAGAEAVARAIPQLDWVAPEQEDLRRFDTDA